METLAYLVLFLCLSLQDRAVGEDTEWDFFVFTQEWTPSACIDAKKKCLIPKEVTGWTVHGLWPNRRGTEEPNYCKPSMKFDWNQIKSLEANLTAQWPNVFVGTKKDELWCHEWEKHGTCALTLSATDTEYRYFSKALELSTQLSTTQVLKKFGVIPSNTTGYEVSDVAMMLEKQYGRPAKLQCTFDNSTNRQLFVSIELCLNKTFEFVECDNGRFSNSECRSEEKAYLIPLSTSHSAFKQSSEYVITP